MIKYKYHRFKESFFSGRCMGAKCWSCHSAFRTHDLYGNKLTITKTEDIMIYNKQRDEVENEIYS